MGGHARGACKPCHFMHSLKGCKSGSDCTFCHLPHVACSEESSNRPSKDKREKIKQIVASVCATYGNQSEETRSLLNEVASQSSYMQKIILENQLKQLEPGEFSRKTSARNMLQKLNHFQSRDTSTDGAAAAALPGNVQKRPSRFVSL